MRSTHVVPLPARPMDVSWAAGLFEGEGTVGIQRQAGRVRLRFALAMTDEDVVRRFHHLIGAGHVNGPNWHQGSTKPQWRWSATKGSEALYVAHFLRPFMGARRGAAIDESVYAFVTQPAPRRHKSEKQYCPKGHAYDLENLLVRSSDGRRRCRECERKRSHRKNGALPGDGQPSLLDREGDQL